MDKDHRGHGRHHTATLRLHEQPAYFRISEQTEQPEDGAETPVQWQAHFGRGPRPALDAREPRPLR